MNFFSSKFCAIALLIASSSQAFAASSLYYPKPGGVICDKKAGFCADDQGVSVAITQMELGEKASKALMAEINKVGVANFDTTSFTMSGGLHCETKEKKCYNKLDKKPDLKATKALFGK